MSTKPTKHKPVIIVIGAGASGLAFALTCISQGLKVRIIEERDEIHATVDKATGVAQDIWNKLSPLGIAPSTTPDAIPLSCFVVHDDDVQIASISVPHVHGAPPAHFYPQGELETQMVNALKELGAEIEYGVTFEKIEQDTQTVRVLLQKTNQSETEHVQADWLVAADGAHSAVRRFFDIPFPGIDYTEKWSVAEIETELWPLNTQVQLYLHSNGVAVFSSRPKAGNIQAIMNAEGAGHYLLEKFSDSQIVYDRSFDVSLRRVETPRLNRVWLIGDAAHVQSPVGGQGMNLAIWDAITLAEALLKNDLSVDKRLAKRAKYVLLFTDSVYRILSTRSPVVRAVRNLFLAASASFPVVGKWFFKILSGVW